MKKAIISLIDELDNAYNESDYVEKYEFLELDLHNETRYIKVVKDDELIKSYKKLVDNGVISIPYYDEVYDDIIYIGLTIQYVNVLDDYVELVILLV